MSSVIGNEHRTLLFPQVLLAIFPDHGLIKALGKGVAVIFKEGADTVFIESVLEPSALS